jgi:hypothetical protein
VRHELGSSLTYGFLVLLGVTGLHLALLLVALFDEVVPGIVREVQIHYQELETLAVTCGQNRYDGLPLTDLPDPLDSDFVGATRLLTCIGHGNAANIVKTQCILLGLGQASSWLRSIELAKKMDCNTTSDFRSDRDATIFEARIDYLRNTCKVLLLEAEREKCRMQDMSQTVSRHS